MNYNKSKNRYDFSPKEYEYWQNFLIARDGYSCQNCYNDVNTLIRQSKPNRKLPVLVIDHISGDTRFTDDQNGNHGGNLRHLCYSCNRKNTKSTRPTLPMRDLTPEHEKSNEAEPLFNNWLKQYLIEYKNICHQKMLNRGAVIAKDSSQVTVNRYYLKRADVIGGYEEFEIYNHAVDCDYSKCNGIHVCFYGEIPREEDVARKQALQEGLSDYHDADKFT